MTYSGVLTGTVITGDGWPVPHAVVTVIDSAGTQSARTTVRHDGYFTVAGLSPGAYTVITAAPGMIRKPVPAWSTAPDPSTWVG